MLLAKGKITPDHIHLLKSWKHSGFQVYCFLARLARRALPLPEVVQQSVREIILLERGPNWTLYGKTGWENVPHSGVGWWVGWVEKEGRIHAFALNMDIRDGADGNRRLELGERSLKNFRIL